MAFCRNSTIAIGEIAGRRSESIVPLGDKIDDRTEKPADRYCFLHTQSIRLLSNPRGILNGSVSAVCCNHGG